MRRNLTYGLLLAILGGACIVSAPAGAETYKWVDAEGKIHYTDQPPPANAKELDAQFAQTTRASDICVAARQRQGHGGQAENSR